MDMKACLDRWPGLTEIEDAELREGIAGVLATAHGNTSYLSARDQLLAMRNACRVLGDILAQNHNQEEEDEPERYHFDPRDHLPSEFFRR